MSNIMKYKGYWARIQYSDEDQCFFGKVEGLKHSLILFEGETVKELKKDFKDAIDHYLESCKLDNEEPEVQCKGSLNVRLGPELHVEAKIKSEEKNISINEFIKQAVANYINVC